METQNQSSIYQRPVELLQKLVQFDTTNPPGNEIECISYINNLLQDAGFETTFLSKTPQRPNLITRLKGRGEAPPLLLYGHVDVVTTANQQWTHPPFEGKIVDEYIWGRGTLDMKGGVAMMLAALLRAKAEKLAPAGDIVLAVLSDEENGGDYGAKFLVEEHPEQFEGIRHALGEFGGFTLHIAGKRFYPIQVAEKQICWMKATVKGQGGHGSLPVSGGAMAKLSKFLLQLDKHWLPTHVTPVTEMMFSSIASNVGGLTGLILGQLTNPAMTDRVLKLLGARGNLFSPLLHNTVSPTILHASDKVNVIPSEVSVELDGRLLPGYSPEDMINELRTIVGNDVIFEVIRYDPGPSEFDLGMFNTLKEILVEADPGSVPIPFLMSGVTDGRFFSHLGIQTYGFIPMKLPEDFNFSEYIHAADERIPVEAVEFGANATFQALKRFGNNF
ncbi:MAG: M20/M25/M40 family metallo-hydrolase [Anaerolineales bacterium]|nr:M20/M25/M40 family metallo-hydrolase [Chloroflexota bacterium]MBL6979929.1 M20/M25/M40 family metallo-hydrolase [Anaerolineales bacterium]